MGAAHLRTEKPHTKIVTVIHKTPVEELMSSEARSNVEAQRTATFCMSLTKHLCIRKILVFFLQMPIAFTSLIHTLIH